MRPLLDAKLKETTIGVVGGGTVGQAVARSYLEHVKEVRVYDLDPTRRTHYLTSCEPNSAVLDCDVVFVCLPTPLTKGDKCNLVPINSFFEKLMYLPDVYPNRIRQTNFILRSTVPIGTTKRLAEKYQLPNLVYSPEFLTARCALVDAQIPSRNIIGVPGSTASRMWNRDEDGDLALDACQLYKQRWPHVRVFPMTSDEAEAVKLFQNSIFATTVTLWNELYNIAEKMGLDWDTVRNAILADGRIHPSHTQVPGPDGKRGYGGQCLTKDISFLIDCALDAGAKPWLTTCAHITNRDHYRKEA